MRSTEEIVAEWCTRDHARALLPVDHEIVEASRAARTLVVDLVRARTSDRDLFHAWATLGRIFAERGGSPTLAATTIDSAREAIGNLVELSASRVEGARASVMETFVRTGLELARAEGAARWEYPRCVVALDSGGDAWDGAIAIAAGYPDDDGEALAGWAARVASAAARAGARRAILSGSDAARHALADALILAGVEVRVSSPPPRIRAR